MSDLRLDFVVFAGDPDEGAQAVGSEPALDEAASFEWPGAYGRVIVQRDGQVILQHKPDPIFSLVTNLVRALSYVIEGEAENVLLAESEQGFAIEPAGNDVLLSFFAGDPYDPDELTLEPQTFSLDAFGEQVLSMGERLVELMRKSDADIFERDEYSGGLVQFLEEGREAFKTYQLRVERGLRVE